MYKKELESYYKKLIDRGLTTHPDDSTEKEVSIFFNDIRKLIIDTDKILGKTRPYWNGDLWEQRHLQLRILRTAMRLVMVGPLPDDSSLFAACHFVLKYCSTSFFYSIYNGFKDSLGEILKRIHPNQIHLNASSNVAILQKLIPKKIFPTSKNVPSITDDTLVDSATKEFIQRTIEENVRGTQMNGMSGEAFIKGIVAVIRAQIGREVQETSNRFSQIVQEYAKNLQVYESSFAETLTLFNQHWMMVQYFRTTCPREYEAYMAKMPFKEIPQPRGSGASSPQDLGTPTGTSSPRNSGTLSPPSSEAQVETSPSTAKETKVKLLPGQGFLKPPHKRAASLDTSMANLNYKSVSPAVP